MDHTNFYFAFALNLHYTNRLGTFLSAGRMAFGIPRMVIVRGEPRGAFVPSSRPQSAAFRATFLFGNTRSHSTAAVVVLVHSFPLKKRSVDKWCGAPCSSRVAYHSFFVQ
jgi:hypothetical protein